MTVRKVQFESMDEVNRFLDVTEHFPFAVDLKRGNRTVNGKSILGCDGDCSHCQGGHCH
jgi:phosphocarrier protein HPr